MNRERDGGYIDGNGGAAIRCYQEPGIKSVRLNKEILRLIECNDPKVTELDLRTSDGIEGVGNAIGNNTVLQMIDAFVQKAYTRDWLNELFRGLARNRTIEVLCLTYILEGYAEVENFPILAPFF